MSSPLRCRPWRSRAPETLRLYTGDCAATPLPAAVANYLTTLGERLSAGALARRSAAIAAQHRSHGLISPASDPAVTTLLRPRADDLDGCGRPTPDSVPGHKGGERPPA